MKVKLKIMASLVASIVGASSLPASAENEKVYFEKLDDHSFEFKGGNEKKIAEVLYFFNLSCQACSSFTPLFSNWAESIDKDEIDVRYIPVVTNSSWKWAAIASLSVRQNGDDVTVSDMTHYLGKRGATIDTASAASAFVSDLTPLSYDEALEDILSQESANTLAVTGRLFSDFNAAGTPNIGITMKSGERYLIGPQHGNNFYEMMSVTNGLISYQKKKNEKDKD